MHADPPPPPPTPAHALKAGNEFELTRKYYGLLNERVDSLIKVSCSRLPNAQHACSAARFPHGEFLVSCDFVMRVAAVFSNLDFVLCHGRGKRINAEYSPAFPPPLPQMCLQFAPREVDTLLAR